MTDQSTEYWTEVAREGFEDDFFRLLDKSELTQKQLAERRGVSEAHVSQFINGIEDRNPQLTTMVKWARALGATLHIRLVSDGEILRVVDSETAKLLDSTKRIGTIVRDRAMAHAAHFASARPLESATVIQFPKAGIGSDSASVTDLRTSFDSPGATVGDIWFG